MDTLPHKNIFNVEDTLFARLMSQLPFTLLSGLLVVYSMGYLLLQSVPNTVSVYLWITVQTLLTLVRFHVIYHHSKVKKATKGLVFYNHSISFLLGLAWASVLFFFDPDNPLYLQMAILAILIGIPVASLSTNANVFLSHLSIALPPECVNLF